MLLTLFVRIHPWHYGVKQNIDRRRQSRTTDATTGFALRIPGVHKWHMIDRRTHFVTFAEDEPGVDARPHAAGARQIRTKDANTADLRPDGDVQGASPARRT